MNFYWLLSLELNRRRPQKGAPSLITTGTCQPLSWLPKPRTTETPTPLPVGNRHRCL